MPKKTSAKLKLVLDSNVFISALMFGGKPREVLELAVRGLIEIAVSDDILEEIKEVLLGKKFQFSGRVVRGLLREIEDLANLVEPEERIDAVLEDPADNRVLECAVASGAGVIVSGDSHLLTLQSFGRVKILSPDEFLRLYIKRRRP